MEYTKLGRTGLSVSRICLGTMNFGTVTEEKEAFRIMDAALDAGINFIDTANNYGQMTGNEGITETIIGRWFSMGGGRRERTVLATKVHEDMKNPYDGPNTAPGLSAYKIRRHLKASLERLQTDHLEIYYMHHVDRHCSMEELWETFQALFQSGVIDYVGASNFPAWKIAQAQERAAMRHFMGIALQQERYSLLHRFIESEVLPACKEYGLGVVTWSPLGGGMLAGNVDDMVRRKGNTAKIKLYEEQLRAYGRLCRDAGLKEGDVALAWILSNPAITAPIIGPRTCEQFEASLKALEIKLPCDMLAELDRIFPGPGAAPEAYAW